MAKRKIIIVDNDPHILTMMRSLVNVLRPEYEVIIATTGFSALDKLCQLDQPDLVDLVLTENNLPGMSGFDLTRIIRKRLPTMRVVLVSDTPGNTQWQQRLNGVKIDGLIPKPIKLAQFEALLAPASERLN